MTFSNKKNITEKHNRNTLIELIYYPEKII